MAVASYRSRVKRSGTPTAFTNERFKATGTPNQFQIASTARQVWDRTVVPTFKTSSTGTVIPSANISTIDYLFGKVTFNTTIYTTAIVASGTYLPVANVAGANTYTLSLGGDLLDSTDFSTTGYRNRTPGMRDVSLSISRWDNLDRRFWYSIVDPTTSWSTASTAKNFGGSTVIVAEVQPGGSTVFARGFFRVADESRSGDIGSLESAEVTLEIDEDSRASFRWSDQ